MLTLTRRKAAPVVPAWGEWDPFRLMEEMLRWDPFTGLGPHALVPEARGFAPNFEVKETKDGYFFKADLPGVKETDVEVALTGNRLTVGGKREEERREEGEIYFACERRYGGFTRVFRLPEDADTEHVRAKLKEGVLTIVVPHKPEVEPRRIEVTPEAAKEAAAEPAKEPAKA